ncbi:type IV pilus modification protein PilV [Massilia violaceinigra]|uniref:Type IV pilus modification protein PilV n=1 Tax=Massilia violaceinigra TaxID=2045208 RepID=A0A2D2DTQ1_9BURK|nr:type IV pilus modification protein PilV [Massilia violaceinigra]ATQ78354.1 type IV pilus modification protein PilV [Massilia violaceinigra]
MRLSRKRVAGGFTLTEVLVAVLLLTVGILGALGTQVAALRTHQGASLMSRGVQLASSLAGRMQANAGQMQRDDLSNPYLQLHYDAADGAPPPAPAQCYGMNRCDSAQLAQFDIADTIAALHAGFPGGRIAVCRDATVWDEARLALAWECAGAAGAPVVIKLGWRAKRADGAADAAAGAPSPPAVAVMLGTGAP